MMRAIENEKKSIGDERKVEKGMKEREREGKAKGRKGQ